MTQRIQRHPYLAIFDGADPSASTPLRTVSTTPLQALYLLNDAFIHRQAEEFAARITADATDDDDARIQRAYRLALARPADADEAARSRAFLAAVRGSLAAAGQPPPAAGAGSWQAFARVLYRLNEFAYLD